MVYFAYFFFASAAVNVVMGVKNNNPINLTAAAMGAAGALLIMWDLS